MHAPAPRLERDLGETLALRQARAPNVEPPPTGATPAAAFFAARRMFLQGRRVDMQALAAELSISRATLYRWTGHREQLIGDVMWALSDDVFQQAGADHPEHTGRKRLLAIYRQHVGVLVGARPLHTFLQQETHAALRVLTSPQGVVHTRTVRRLAELYREEERSGAFQPKADIDVLAYAVVRLTEGFIYNDAIATVEPEVERAESVVALLLQ